MNNRTRLRAALTASVASLAIAAPFATAGANEFPVVSSCDSSVLNNFFSTWGAGQNDHSLARSRWVPQGLAYASGPDWLISSWHHEDNLARPALVIAKRSNFAPVKTIHLPLDFSYTDDHVGGLAVAKSSLYVATNREGGPGSPRVIQFRISDVINTLDGGYLPRPVSTTTVAAASYAGAYNGNLFVGSFTNDGPGRVYRYDLSADGRIVTPAANDWPTPSHVNGIAITDDNFVFSRSNGRRVGGLVTVRPRGGGPADESTSVVKNMAEGIDWAPTPSGSPATDDSRTSHDLRIHLDRIRHGHGLPCEQDLGHGQVPQPKLMSIDAPKVGSTGPGVAGSRRHDFSTTGPLAGP